MQLVQCSRCGKPADLDQPVVFRHEDGSPMEPTDRPQPWVLLTIQSLQASYVLPDGSRWPSQDRKICDDCLPGVLGALSKDFSGTTNVKEQLFEEPPLDAVVELATKEEPIIEAPAVEEAAPTEVTSEEPQPA